MKKILYLLIVLIAISCKEEVATNHETITNTEITTYYLIRHAEKNRTDAENKDPKLIAPGLLRAEHWASVFQKVPLNDIYVTQYMRVKQTAAPTAVQKGLDVKEYSPNDLYNEEFQKATKGKTVLIVGHSDTTSLFVNAILGKDQFPQMDDSDNASLYIVTVAGDTKKAQVLIIE